MRIGYALPLVKGTKEALEQAELLASLAWISTRPNSPNTARF